MFPHTDAAPPTFESQLDAIAAAERGDGWLSVCEHDGRFLIPTEQFVETLDDFLRRLDAGPVLEICAGRGKLAEAIRSAAVPVVATDANPPAGAPVLRASADEALRRYQPAVVLGCFVPIDAGIDRRVMDFPSVRHYVVLGARVGGLLGSAALWQSPGWTAELLEQVGQWMVTRHDIWVPGPPPCIIRHGEAWHFHRKESSD